VNDRRISKIAKDCPFANILVVFLEQSQEINTLTLCGKRECGNILAQLLKN
jgi:hypothetical protein